MAKFHSEQTHRVVDRVRSAESKMRALKAENAELRKQLFRAQEAARIAGEEALGLRRSIAPVTQSRDTAVRRNAALQADLDLWRREAEDLHHAATAPRPSFFQRLTGRLA